MWIYVLIAFVIIYYLNRREKKKGKDGNNPTYKYLLWLFGFYLGAFIITMVLRGIVDFVFSDDSLFVLKGIIYVVEHVAILGAFYLAACEVGPMALRDKGLSNGFLHLYFMVPWIVLLYTVFSSVIMIVNLLIGEGSWIVILIGIAVLIYGLVRIKSILMYRCNNCREYPGSVVWVGMVKDGIEVEHKQKSGGYTETNYDGTEVRDTATRTNITEYYQMYKNHYGCRLCGARWHYNVQGELLGKDVEHHKNTKTTKYL